MTWFKPGSSASLAAAISKASPVTKWIVLDRLLERYGFNFYTSCHRVRSRNGGQRERYLCAMPSPPPTEIVCTSCRSIEVLYLWMIVVATMNLIDLPNRSFCLRSCLLVKGQKWDRWKRDLDGEYTGKKKKPLLCCCWFHQSECLFSINVRAKRLNRVEVLPSSVALSSDGYQFYAISKVRSRRKHCSVWET